MFDNVGINVEMTQDDVLHKADNLHNFGQVQILLNWIFSSTLCKPYTAIMVNGVWSFHLF